MGNSRFSLPPIWAEAWNIGPLILFESALAVVGIAGFSFSKDLVSLIESTSLVLVVICLIAEVKVLSGLPDSPVGGIRLVTPGWSLSSLPLSIGSFIEAPLDGAAVGSAFRLLSDFPISVRTLNLSLGSDLSCNFKVEWYPTSVKTLLMGKILRPAGCFEVNSVFS